MAKKNNKKTKVNVVDRKKNYILFILIISLCAFLAYFPSLENGSTNWDDDQYVFQNEDLYPLGENISKLLTKNYVGNYHPVTMLSLAFDRNFSKEASSFHASSLFLHIVCSILVFALFVLLLGSKPWIAFFIALLFSLHPMHVESVAWISARKDLVYTAFYILSCIFFLRNIRGSGKLIYTLSIICFALACLSKPTAIVLPFALLLIAYFENKLNKTSLLKILPFGILSIVFVIISFAAQQEAGAVAEQLSGMERLLVPIYAIGYYSYQFISASNLAAYHPFPESLFGDFRSIFALVCGVFMIVYLLYAIKKKRRLEVFGIGFFLINLVLVIHLIPFGSSIVAERYTYLPYVGLLLIAVHHIYNAFTDKMAQKGMLLAISGILIMVCREETKVWKDSLSLWSNVLEVHPTASRALNNRAVYYMDLKQYNSALKDLDKLIEHHPKTPKAHYNKAVSLSNSGRPEESIKYFEISLKKKPNDFESNYGLANSYTKMGKFKEANLVYDRLLNENPNDYRVNGNKAVLHFRQGEYQDAIKYFSKAIELNPAETLAYKNRSAAYIGVGDGASAIPDLNKYLIAFPTDTNGLYYLSRAHKLDKNNKMALEYAQEAQKNGMNLSDYIRTLN